MTVGLGPLRHTKLQSDTTTNLSTLGFYTSFYASWKLAIQRVWLCCMSLLCFFYTFYVCGLLYSKITIIVVRCARCRHVGWVDIDDDRRTSVRRQQADVSEYSVGTSSCDSVTTRRRLVETTASVVSGRADQRADRCRPSAPGISSSAHLCPRYVTFLCLSLFLTLSPYLTPSVLPLIFFRSSLLFTSLSLSLSLPSFLPPFPSPPSFLPSRPLFFSLSLSPCFPPSLPSLSFSLISRFDPYKYA